MCFECLHNILSGRWYAKNLCKLISPTVGDVGCFLFYSCEYGYDIPFRLHLGPILKKIISLGWPPMCLLTIYIL